MGSRTVRSLGLLAVAALALPLPGCNPYKSDIGKLCDAEQLSQGSLKGGKTALFTWMERNVASSEGVLLVKDLETKDKHGISTELHDEARKAAVTSCPLADAAEMQAKDDDFRTDILNLCAGSALRNDGSVARLDISTADDAERMREIGEWTHTNAKSVDTAAVVAKIAAAQPKQRGALLRAEAVKLESTACPMALALDAPPPPPPVPITNTVTPMFTVLKVDGLGKSNLVAAQVLTTHEPALAIDACYATALAKVPTLSGKVAMKLLVDGTGKVSKASDDGSALKGAILPCIATALQSITFPPAPDGGKKGVKASLALQLDPMMSGPMDAAKIDDAWIAQGPSTPGDASPSGSPAGPQPVPTKKKRR
jgi:hypothetical protein